MNKTVCCSLNYRNVEKKTFFPDKPDKEENQTQSSVTEHTSDRSGKY